MRNKLIIVIVFLIMLSTIFVTEYSAIKIKDYKIKNKNVYSYDEFLEEYGQDLYKKCPVMLEPVIFFNSEDENPILNISNIPSEFSWLDKDGYDWSTSARHQGNCGSCWDFAAVGSLESRIKIAENLPFLPVDLSEQYVLSCLSDAGSCYGGSGINALRYIMNDSEIGNNYNGIIPESCMIYQASHNINCSNKCTDWIDKLVPITEVFSLRPDGSSQHRDQIKSIIMESGPVATHIAATKKFSIWGLDHHDPEEYFSVTLTNSFTNHLVILYGWKDDPSIKNGGYWICKNSWGDYWGYNGFFNIEYGALHIDDSMVVWAEYDPDGFDWEPIANAGKPKGGQIGQELIFDASQSFDDNEIISYHWDFGDGKTSNQKITCYSYLENNVYNVVLKVVDSTGQMSTDEINVWIQDKNTKPEKPDINGKIQGEAGKRYEYTVISEDPDGNDVYYFIEWGDETFEEWIGPYQSGQEVTLKHRWNQHGNYIMKIKTKDVYDAESDWATLEVIMPKNKVMNLNLFLQRFFQHFPLFDKILN